MGRTANGKSWKKRLRDVLNIYCTEKDTPDLLLAADGLDQLNYDEVVKNFSFIPAFKEKKIHFLISFLKGYDMNLYSGDCIEVNCMEEQEKADVLHGILAYQRKGLDQSVIDEAMKKKSSENPLYLSLMVQRLTMMNKDDFDVIAQYGNDMQAINRYQIELISHAPENLEGMCCLLVQETGERVNKKLVQRMAEYIAVSRQGLRERDLRELLNMDGICWDNLSFSRAIHYMPLIFSEKNNGQIDFTHRIIRESLKKNCAKQQLQLNIFQYLQKLLPDDELRLNEIVYYCNLLDDSKYFIEYIQKNSEKARKRAAQGMYQICVKDGGEWFTSIIKNYGKVSINFLENYLNHEFYDEVNELQIQLEMNLAALEWCKNENRKNGIRENNILYSRMNYTVSKIYARQGDYNSALVYCEKYSELWSLVIKRESDYSEYILDEYYSEFSNSCYALAYLYERMGYYERAIEGYNKCIELEQNKADINWASHCLFLISSGRVCELADRVSEALLKLEEANEIIEANKSKLFEKPAYRELYVHSREYMGRAYEKEGDLEKALEEYNNLYSMNRSIFEEERTPLSKRDYGISCMRIGNIYEKKGDMDKALEYYLKDLEICYGIYIEQKTFTAIRDYCVICDRVGMIYEKKNDTEKALEKYLESYNLRAELYGKQDELLYKDDYQISCGNLGRMYFKKGEYMTALNYYIEEEKILKELFDNRYMMNKYSDYSICWGNIAGVYSKLEQYVFSLDAYEKMVYAAEVFYKDNPTEGRKKFYEQKMQWLQTILKQYGLI